MKINSHENNINFGATKILTTLRKSAVGGEKVAYDIYKLNPKEDMEFAKRAYKNITALKESVAFLTSELRTFFATFIAESTYALQNKEKFSSFYLVSPTKKSPLGRFLPSALGIAENNLTNFVAYREGKLYSDWNSQNGILYVIAKQAQKSSKSLLSSGIFVNNQEKQIFRPDELDIITLGIQNTTPELSFVDKNETVDLKNIFGKLVEE